MLNLLFFCSDEGFVFGIVLSCESVLFDDGDGGAAVDDNGRCCVNKLVDRRRCRAKYCDARIENS